MGLIANLALILWLYSEGKADGFNDALKSDKCAPVIKADGTKTAAEVVTEFQELMKGMNGG